MNLNILGNAPNISNIPYYIIDLLLLTHRVRDKDVAVP